MARSKLSPHGPEIAKKTFRATAKAQGLTFKAAAEARNLLPKPKTPIAPGMGRRMHGRIGDTVWNGSVYVDVSELEEGDLACREDNNCTVCAIWHEPSVANADGHAPAVPALVSLFDVAKPAKAKGVAKDFEVIDLVKRVIALRDEEDEMSEWEEWEDIYGDEDSQVEKMTRVTYAAVVRAREEKEFEDG